MLTSNYSRKAAIFYLIVETAKANVLNTPPLATRLSCTTSDSNCFEDKTTNDYLSYFNISNLSLLTPPAWTPAVSEQSFGNSVSHTKKGTLLVPSSIPDVCKSNQAANNVQSCTSKTPIQQAPNIVNPSNLSFDDYLSSFYVAWGLTNSGTTTGEPEIHAFTANFKNMWSTTGTPVVSSYIGTNEMTGDSQDYAYFSPWESITNISYKILKNGVIYSNLQQFTFSGTSQVTVGQSSAITSQLQTLNYQQPTGKIIGVGGEIENTNYTCSLSFVFNLCSCYSSFYFMTDNTLQTVYLEMGVAQEKAFLITDGVTGVYSGQKCGPFLTSAQSVIPNAAFSAAVTPTSGNTSSVTISTTDTQFMGTTQNVKIQVENFGFTTAASSGIYYLPTMTFIMAVVINCRVYAQSPQITANGISTFDYFIFSGTLTTPAFVSLQKMNYDQTKFCAYDLDYTTSVSPTTTGLTLAIDKAGLTVSLNSFDVSIKDTSLTVTVNTNLTSADNSKYLAQGWTYPQNGFRFIVDIKCNVVAFAFKNSPVDITSTELRADVTSASFTASESTQSCGYPIVYSYSTLPSWVTYNAVTNTFKIVSSNVTPTGIDQTTTIIMTATITLPAGYRGTKPVTATQQIIAKLLAVSITDLCLTKVLTPVVPPEVQIFVGMKSNFTFTEFKISNSVSECGDLKVTASFNGVTVDWITVSNTGSHITADQIFNVKVDGSLGKTWQSGNLTVVASLVNYPSVVVKMTSKLTIYQLVFGKMLDVAYTGTKLFRYFDYQLLPQESPPSSKLSAFIAIKDGEQVPHYLPSSSTFKITFVPPQFSFFSNSKQNAGNYSIVYQIDFPDFPLQNQNRTFNLEIAEVSVIDSQDQGNRPPYFAEPNDWPYFKVLTCGDRWSYKMPEIVDDDKDDHGVLQSVDLQQAVSFVNFSTRNGFTIDEGFLTSKYNGKYQIEATLQDLNGARTSYTIDLVVTCFEANVAVWKPLNSSNPPLPFIYRISGLGKVDVKFNEEMLHVNATNITNGTILIDGIERPLLDVRVMPEDESQVFFTWECLNFTSQEMVLQLHFENPSHISNSIPLDMLHLTFWGQPAYKAANRTDYVPFAYNISYQIPSQMDPKSGAVLKDVLINASLVTKINMFGSYIVQVLISGSLQQIFELIAEFQIIVHMNLVNISVPASVSIYYSYLFSIISFSLLPTDEYFDKWFQLPHQTPITLNFGQLGYETTFFLRNLGSQSFFLVFWPLQMICAHILAKVKHRKAIKWSRSWKKILMWTQLLSYIEVQSVLICVSFLLNTMYCTSDGWYYIGQLFNFFMAVIVGSVVCLYPFFQLYMLLKLFPKIQRENGFIKQRWHYWFEELHIPLNSSKLKHLDSGKFSIGYVFYTKLHQITLAYSVCTMIRQPVFCMFLFNYTALFAMILAGVLRPFSLPSRNISEMLGKFALLVLNYHLLCLTDFVSDPWTREIIGYSMCSFITLFLSVNMVVICLDLVRQWARKFKMHMMRRQNIKNHCEKLRMLHLLNEQYLTQISTNAHSKDGEYTVNANYKKTTSQSRKIVAIQRRPLEEINEESDRSEISKLSISSEISKLSLSNQSSEKPKSAANESIRNVHGDKRDVCNEKVVQSQKLLGDITLDKPNRSPDHELSLIIPKTMLSQAVQKLAELLRPQQQAEEPSVIMRRQNISGEQETSLSDLTQMKRREPTKVVDEEDIIPGYSKPIAEVRAIQPKKQFRHPRIQSLARLTQDDKEKYWQERKNEIKGLSHFM